MATIVNNPPPENNSSNGPIGLIIILVALLILVYVGIVYGLPALRNLNLGNTQVNIPNKIDVNVHNSNPTMPSTQPQKPSGY